METNISDGAIEFSVKNCIAGESYRFGAKKSPAPASNPEVYTYIEFGEKKTDFTY